MGQINQNMICVEPSRISVVLCTYNGEKYLPSQLDSLLSQTIHPYEIIVGDDGSTDGTHAILGEYSSRFEELGVKFHVFQHSGLGAHNNFKTTFKYAQGDYIAPCDQDDIWNPEKLERCLNAMSDVVDVVLCHEKIVYEDGTIGNPPVQTFRPDKLLWGNTLYGHLMLFKRKVIEVYNISPEITFDWGVALYGSATGRGRLIDYDGCLWRRHEGVVTTAFSLNYGVIKVADSKWSRFFKCMHLLLHRQGSQVIHNTMDNTAKVFKYYGLIKYAKIATLISMQTIPSMLYASYLYLKLAKLLPEYENCSCFRKIGYCCYNFCYPTTWWYTYHLHKSL